MLNRRLSLDGRTVAITGAAGGLGRALSAALHAKGAKLALFDLDLAAAQDAASELPGSRGWAADVTDYASVQAAMDAAAAHFGGIDVVIANAGLGSMAPVATLDPAVWDKVIDVDLSGVFRTYRAALPYVTKRKGYLLGVSSMAAYVNSPLQAPYSAAKVGVLGLTNCLRQELKGSGTRCGTLHPHFFRSPMMDMVDGDAAGQELWGGNKGQLFGYIKREDVVAAAVKGIEKRSRRIVVPTRFAGMALMPGLLLPVIEILGFRKKHVRKAMELADPGKISATATVRTNDLVDVTDSAPVKL
jgi:NAD(P)-dependent dehydrogenase (short-subunit alcohol dehydrogenase family)